MSGRTTLEIPISTPARVDALQQDRVGIMREAILWQRPLRLAALGATALLAFAFGEADRLHTLPLYVVVAIGYWAVLRFTSVAVSRRAGALDWRLPTLLLTADVATAAVLVWLSSPPSGAPLLLLPALLVIQLASYYYGRALGLYGVVLATAAYLLVAFALPASVPGPAETWRHALFTGGLFALVGIVLVRAQVGFHDRMNQLRLFCRLVEEGDLAPAVAVGGEARPDDVTLLARSFDAMRMRLAEQIGTDPLSGCLNRRALETRLRAEWRHAKRRGTTVALLAIDIDHFKKINDTRGHPFGDLVLQELANILKQTARDTDTVARIGGDEFVIVLPDTGWQGALTFAERLRRKVEEYAFGASAGAEPLSISVGVALARGTDPISPEMLLQEADRSLYKAKSGGRNRIFA